MKNIFPNVPSLLEAIFRSGYWHQGSALLRLVAPYLSGAVLAGAFAGLNSYDTRWWVWVTCALTTVMLIVKFATVPAGFTVPIPQRYAVPFFLIIGGSGLFMIANGPLARAAAGLLVCFSLVIGLRAVIRALAGVGAGQASHAASIIFASSIALFSTAVSVHALVTLLNFPALGAVAFIFLACMSIIRQAVWWLTRNAPQITAWVWILSVILAEAFFVSLLLPMPVVSGAAFVWLAFAVLMEFFRIRLREPHSNRHVYILSTVYAGACIILFFTARWP